MSAGAGILGEDESKSWMHCIANRGKMNDWKAEAGRQCESGEEEVGVDQEAEGGGGLGWEEIGGGWAF